MRKYYLFKIKDLKIDLNKTYLILEELFYLNSNKFNYGKTIFENLCLSFNKEKIIEKLGSNKFVINDLENTIIEVNNTCIIIETSKNITKAFKYLNELESNIFVVDFDNRDYFLLDDFIKLNFKISI